MEIDLKIKNKNITLNLDNNDLIGIYTVQNINIDDNNSNYNFIDFNRIFFTKKVSDEFFLYKREIEDDLFLDKVLSSLKMVGLSDEFLEREFSTLSKSERNLLTLALAFLNKSDIMIFNNIEKNLDNKNKNNIIKIIKKLKNNYDKKIIIIDSNINFIYEFCSYIVILKDNKVLVQDKKNVIFNDLNIFLNNNIEIPFLVNFSYIANNYNINIPLFDNVNDLIKVVYRNAKREE